MAISNRPSHSTGRSEDYNDYWRAFRKQVFQLLKWGYDRLNVQQYQASEEEDITGDLAKEIDDIVQDRERPEWVGRFSVHEEKPINTSERKGKRRQRLDIELERVRVRYGSRPRYAFEAKRLCKNSHPIGVYLGPEGLGEFLAGHYVPERDEAGMLGYVQSDTPAVWSKKAQDKFRTAPDLVQECNGGGWSEVRVLRDLEYCYCSEHHRLSVEKPITLYHLFFVFC